LPAVDQAAPETAVVSTQLVIPVVVVVVAQTAEQAAEQVEWLKYSTIQLYPVVKLDCTWVWAAAKCSKTIYNR
jgi:hypothetical protein